MSDMPTAKNMAGTQAERILKVCPARKGTATLGDYFEQLADRITELEQTLERVRGLPFDWEQECKSAPAKTDYQSGMNDMRRSLAKALREAIGGDDV